MNTFTLSIDLGNEAMSTPDDVRNALLYVADQLLNYDYTPCRVWNEYDKMPHPIRDTSGNRVGEWLVKGVEPVKALYGTIRHFKGLRGAMNEGTV